MTLRRDYSLGPQGSLFGDDGSPTMRLLAGSDETEGRYALVAYTIDYDIAPHVHLREDESVYVLDGEITVHVGDADHRLVPGSFVFMPRGVPHAITKHTETWRGLSVSAPGGVFDAMLEELNALRASGMATPEGIRRIQEKYGFMTRASVRD